MTYQRGTDLLNCPWNCPHLDNAAAPIALGLSCTAYPMHKCPREEAEKQKERTNG